MPQYDYLLLLSNSQKVAKHAITNTTTGYSTNEMDFGIVNTAGLLSLKYPGVNKSGMFGAHIIITQAFTVINSGMEAWVVHGAATAPTTKLSARFLSKTELAVLGAHYFIPVAPENLLQFARLCYKPVTENATLGKVLAWFGPDSDGAT